MFANKKTMIAIAGAILLSACGHNEKSVATKEPTKLKVQVVKIEEASTALEHVASGSLRGENTATITSRTMGYVRTLKVEPGQLVKEGQVLATLDSSGAAAGLRSARAGAAEAKAARGQFGYQVDAANSGLKIAKTTRDRMEKLLRSRAITQQQFDEAEAKFQAARASHAAAQAGMARAESRIAQAGAMVDGARTNLGFSRVRAPFDGEVIDRPINVGDLASPGTPLFVVEKDGALRAEVGAPESLAGQVKLGDEVRVDIDAAEKSLIGKVAEIIPNVDPASRTFMVKVDLPKTDRSNLRPGMFVRASFATGKTSVLRIPFNAISAKGSLDRVFVLDGERARMRLVTLGKEIDGQREILSGLDSGETIIVDPPRTMLDRHPVSVASATVSKVPATKDAVAK